MVPQPLSWLLLDSLTSLEGSGVMPDGTSRFTDAEGKEIKRLGHESTFGLVVSWLVSFCCHMGPGFVREGF